MSVRDLLNRRLETDRERRLAGAIATVLVVAIAAVLYLIASPGDDSNGGDRGRRTPGGPVATTPPPDPGKGRPSPRPAGAAFARSYMRYLDGRAGPGVLASYGERARRTAVEVGQVPDRVRSGRLDLLSVTGGPTSADPIARITARVADRRHSYTFTAALNYRSGKWRVVDLVPPDITTVIAQSQPAREPAPPSGARTAARRFAAGYVDWVDQVKRKRPAGTLALRRQLTTRRHPLAGAAPTRVRATVEKLDIGPRQGTTITATASVDTGDQTVEFSFLLERTGGRWQPSGFIS